MRTETGTVIRLEDYRPSDYLIETTDLSFSLQPDATVVRAKLGIRRREGVLADAPLTLDGDELVLKEVDEVLQADQWISAALSHYCKNNLFINSREGGM